MNLSQNQAAKAAGVSRTQIARLIQKVKLSVQNSSDGDPTIDLSELRRVYPTADPDRPRSPAPGRENVGTVRATAPSSTEQAVIQERLAASLRDNDRLNRELDRLRGEAASREERSAAEVQRLLGLLEDVQRRLLDQRPRGLWAKLTGRT
jgi:hypothetical protein